MDVEGGGGDGGETKGETKEVAVVDVRSAPLALPMMVLIAQQRDHLVYHTQTKHIKLIGYLTDQCQMILGQFLDFQQQHLEPHVAAEAKKGLDKGHGGGGDGGDSGDSHALVPSLDILRQWHVPPEIAYHIHRKRLGAMFVGAPTASFGKGGSSTGGSSTGSTGGDKAGKAGKGQPWHTVVESTGDTLSGDVWESISPSLYATFWTLSLYDIYIPRHHYEDQVRNNDWLSVCGYLCVAVCVWLSVWG
jgi:THO complex subunit 2